MICIEDETFKKSSCSVNLRNSTLVTLERMLCHCSDLPWTLYYVKKRMQIVLKMFVVSLEILIEYLCLALKNPINMSILSLLLHFDSNSR